MTRLKSRISRLEIASSESLSRSEQLMLVSILGRRDALFWPWRFQANLRTPLPEIRRRQREYLSGSAGITAKADGREQWKAAHTIRQNLIANGMITANHSGGQVQSCFLTPTGEAYARALVGSRLRSYQSVRVLMALLMLRSGETSVRAVRESMLFGIDCIGGSSEWNEFTELMLPMLTCGIVTQDSDTEGRAAYTPHADTIPEPPLIEVDVQAHSDFDDCYIASFNDERHVLQNCEPRDPSEIYIPKPATGWGWKCHYPQETTNEEK